MYLFKQMFYVVLFFLITDYGILCLLLFDLFTYFYCAFIAVLLFILEVSYVVCSYFDCV